MHCRRKALLALSCLTRHCDPAMGAFRDQDGLQLLLRTAADASDARQQRYLCTFVCCPVVISVIVLRNERQQLYCAGPCQGS